jgi:hypothetical protein
MADPKSGAADVAGRLHAVAVLLRDAHHLGPEAQRELAAVVDELSRAVALTPLPAPEAIHLADSAAHLAEALKRQPESGVFEVARDKLMEASVVAESRAPTAAGLLRQIADALSSIGI